MSDAARKLVILGSTGSIGCSALDLVAALPGRFRVVGLSGHSRLERLAEQAREFEVENVAVTDGERAGGSPRFFADRSGGTESTGEPGASARPLTGPDAVEQLIRIANPDIVLNAIVGAAGLSGSWATLKAGKTLALANKETLVVAGPLVTRLAARTGATILPVDSEHSAIFQALQSGRRSDIRRVILTASGGPFRRATRDELSRVTVAQALSHPTWEMGRKITIDSATMMNKALEIVEARWLFDLDPDRIEVVVHPQSVVHSLVEFQDGSVVAQLSPPDMRLPIQYALTYPERLAGPAERVDWTRPLALEFEPPDHDRFPALRLGYEVARAGGTAGAVVNAANEAAVAAFLREELSFTAIVPACRAALENHPFEPNPTLDRLRTLDAWARQEIAKWIAACSP